MAGTSVTAHNYLCNLKLSFRKIENKMVTVVTGALGSSIFRILFDSSEDPAPLAGRRSASLLSRLRILNVEIPIQLV